MNLELIVGRVESAETKFVLQPDGTIGFGGVARFEPGWPPRSRNAGVKHSAFGAN